MPYEKVGKNEPVCIAEEVPFDIPDNWEWVRLKDICLLVDGDKISERNLPILDAKFLRGKTTGIYVNQGKFVKSGTTIILVDGENSGEVFVAPQDGYLGSTFKILKIVQNINLNYILKFIENNKDFLKNSKKGAAIPHLNKDLFFNLFLGLPPLQEQQRIVDKLKELEPYINDYDKAYEKIEKLNTDFPDLLKKSILQEAVQGKLVPQDPDDEPASVLIEQIRKEKEQLIKDKKIKKDKNESYIFRRDNSHYEKIGTEERCIDDEIPFDIPDSWEWTRLKSICIVNPRNLAEDDLNAGFVPMTLIKDGYTGGHKYETKKWKQIKSGFTHFATGDLVLAKITPCFQNRKSTIISELPNGIGAGTTELHVIRNYPNSKLNLKYLLLLVKTTDFVSAGVKAFTGTAGQQRVGKTFVEDYLVPLPPINEQQKIVDKVNQLLPQISKL